MHLEEEKFCQWTVIILVCVLSFQQESSQEMMQGAVLREALPAPDNRSETSQGTVVPDGKFSLMEFALLNFRESIEK